MTTSLTEQAAEHLRRETQDNLRAELAYLIDQAQAALAYLDEPRPRATTSAVRRIAETAVLAAQMAGKLDALTAVLPTEAEQP